VNKSNVMVTIFLPSGYAWEVEEHRIRTRDRSGKIHMPFRKFPGRWQEWLAAARSLNRKAA
jgi:hypothetical protein